MGSPGFFKLILAVALIAGLAYGGKTYWDRNRQTVKDNTPAPVIYQPPAVPNPYGK